MAEAVITYTDEDSGTVFQWHGGAYIEVGYMTGVVNLEDGGPEFTAIDVINVWNIGGTSGQPEWSDLEIAVERKAVEMTQPRRFRMVLEAFEERCAKYLRENTGE